MAKIYLFTGGTRTGKSKMARQFCESLPGKKLFLATAPVLNDEMKERVQKHQAQRDPEIWDTVEEQFSIAEIFSRSDHDVILVDCLTMWVDNLIYKSPAIHEDDLIPFIQKTFFALEKFEGTVVFVTNEVGFGPLPENPRTRKYRDFVGLTNTMIAKQADTVIFSISGIPLTIKGDSNP